MGDKGTAWLPESASTLAPDVDWLFNWVNIVSLIFFVGVIAAIVYFMFRYRRRSADDQPELVHESTFLEVTWIVVPTILVLLTFNWGFKAYLNMAVSPPDAYTVQVRAKQWLWEFEYPNGTVSTNELRVPVDRPVRLQMSSQDVLHSFFVPVFRVKQDVLPNRYSSVWFEATKTGEFNIFCTEYCGTSHSGMIAKVIVQPQEEFNEWLQSGGGFDELPLPEYGQILYTQQACNTCHSIDGSRIVGPTFQGLFGSQRAFEDGSSATADENYIRQSILEPAAHIVQGYPPVMPPSYTSLNERQLSALIEFIKAQ